MVGSYGNDDDNDEDGASGGDSSCSGGMVAVVVVVVTVVAVVVMVLAVVVRHNGIKANAVRALGNLSRFVQFTSQPGISNEHVDVMGLSLISDSAEELPGRSDLNDKQKEKLALNSFQPASLEDSQWLGKMVQAFLSCVATGNVKLSLSKTISDMAAEEPPAPPSLPQYPEMIMAAIEALNDKNGSSKSAISKHIEATASSDVPAAHATLPAPPSLPQYPEMIMAAIEALNDKNGSSKSAISKHIEATASSDVPAAHATLLSHHLNKMKQSGQLVMVKTNYMKPDPNAPPRRSRGRPPEPKA
ncbi:hypothetical protein TEA_002768 [Camellia sinensis var. sinensis]|uniref:H15 domain-containing protein n=1 Tax=Camellia sinensis var. sinensis TaxID=542762 RepID=A0A4S4EJT9_CAMSN|nr:hypothetical protein TEA_002768 [Camellia sinensis var. sinensis]